MRSDNRMYGSAYAITSSQSRESRCRWWSQTPVFRAPMLMLMMVTGSCTQQLTLDTRHAIALCSGGYEQSVAADLVAAWRERQGIEISAGTSQSAQGVAIFKVGNITGAEAVQMYNTYVDCVRDEAARAASEEDGGRESTNVRILKCGSEWGGASWWFSGYAWQAKYTCLVRNYDDTARHCNLWTACVLRNRESRRIRATHEVEVLPFDIARRSHLNVDGRVRCNDFTTSSQIVSLDRRLACDD